MDAAAIPNEQDAANIITYMKRISGIDAPPRFTINNYIDALVGYRGNSNYVTECAAGTQANDINCNSSDLGNPRGMGRAFINIT